MAIGVPYSGFGGPPWAAAALVVFDFVDPCPTSTLTAEQTLSVQFTPPSLDFGAVQIGQTKTDTIRWYRMLPPCRMP